MNNVEFADFFSFVALHCLFMVDGQSILDIYIINKLYYKYSLITKNRALHKLGKVSRLFFICSILKIVWTKLSKSSKTKSSAIVFSQLFHTREAIKFWLYVKL
jgi:hypothetical protein